MPKIARAKLEVYERQLRGVYGQNPAAEYYDYVKATGLRQPTVKVLLGKLGIPYPTAPSQTAPSRPSDPSTDGSATPSDPVGPVTPPKDQVPSSTPASAPEGEPATPKAQEPPLGYSSLSGPTEEGIGLIPRSMLTPEVHMPIPTAPTTTTTALTPPKAQAPPQATAKAPTAPNPAPLIHQAMRQTAEVDKRADKLEEQVAAILEELKLRRQKPVTKKAPEPDEETEKGDLEERAEKAATGTIASSYATDVGQTARKTYDYDIAAGKFIREKWESTGYRAEFADPASMAEEIFAFYADHRTSIQEFAEENEALKLRVEELEKVAAPGYRAQLRTKALTEICIATKIAGGNFAPHEMAVVIRGLDEVMNGNQ